VSRDNGEGMKEIKAIIQSFMVDAVLDALAQLPQLPGVTLSHVLGWGKARAVSADNPIRMGAHALAAKTKLEVVVRDEDVDDVVDLIAAAARTGNVGDGKIFVIEVVDVVKVRSGARGRDAV